MAYTTINKSTDYFNTTLHTGNGSTQSITGVGFQPDLTWIKRRSADGWHWFTDAVRGTTKTIYSNATNAEETNTNGLTAFGTDGFTVGSNADINGNTQTHVAWNWKANGAGSANTDGALSSTVSANQTSGFSIVQATGTSSGATTIGHGLGVAPKVIIKKQTSQTSNWSVYHASVGASQTGELNLTNAFSASGQWGSTTPTSTVFTNNANSGVTAIYYCFAEKTGYSKFGSYTGNGSSSDGTFVYTGFKPAFLMIKPNAVENWHIFDSARSPSNVTQKDLRPNLNNAESDSSSSAMDFLSNGFKFYNADADYNDTGREYIYMAFGQSLVGSNNVPCTAR